MTSLTPPPVTPSYGSSSLLQALHVLSYDTIDQLGQYQIQDTSSGLALETIGWTRDRDRLLKMFVPPSGAVTYTNTNDRLDTMSLPDGRSVQWFYDATTGRLDHVTGPDGVTIAFGYDGGVTTSVSWSGAITGSLSRIIDDKFEVTSETAGGVTVGFGFDADGALASAGGVTLMRYTGSILLATASDSIATESYTPNGFGETQDYAATVGSSTLFSEHYDRDALGRISARTEQIANADGGLDADSPTYSYDDAGRLSHVTRGAADIEYDYDANGNRLRRHIAGDDADDELGSYDVQDRLLTYGSLTFGYGSNDEVTSGQDANLPSGADTTSYTYDALGNLRQVVLPDGTTIGYLVDGRNRRVGKTVNGTLVRGWIYEDQLRIAAELELDGSGLVKRFVYGSKSNVPDAMVLSTGQRYRILSDHLGSPRLILDSTGAVVERVDYDEYGRRTVVLPAGEADEDAELFSVPFGFAGGLRDADSGLVRFGARDYDPRMGRWVAKDPTLLDSADSNLYAYAANDPINHLDSSGTDWKSALQTLGRILGAILGGPSACNAPSAPDCEKASKFQLKNAGLYGYEHEFKRDYMYGAVSSWDICACEDGSIKISRVGQCGQPGGKTDTHKTWK